MPEGMNTLLVEDLTTDGGSKIQFAKALREAGAICNHTFVVFFYGVFPGSFETLASMDIKPCIISAPGGTCWMAAKNQPYFSDSALWPACANSWKIRWPGRRRMAAWRVRRKRWPANRQL